MLGSILITEHMETLYLFSLKIETYARFDLDHRTGGNLILIFSKDRNLCSVRSYSPNKWKPTVNFL